MSSRYFRRVSFNERLYLASERRTPGFCIQLVVEADGGVDEQTLRRAVEAASIANPGARLVLRGLLGFTRWVDEGPVPPVRIIDGWNSNARPPADVARVLDPKNGTDL